ncbi:hypothetical protein ACQKFK_28900 [Bacillus mycoides]|uniref:hypothetical protein n=1 Tax=Bacillus mycoides TaxID=1405 RepID=UPI003D05C55B
MLLISAITIGIIFVLVKWFDVPKFTATLIGIVSWLFYGVFGMSEFITVIIGTPIILIVMSIKIIFDNFEIAH